jgi:hypothetical protein
MDSQGNYCFVVHFDHREFANMPLRRFEEALEAEGIPLGVSYPSLSDLELFRTASFAPTRRSLAAETGYERLLLPVAEHAAASTAWLEHRLLLAERDCVLRVAEAAARIHEHAATIMERLPIGAGA